MLLLAVVLLMAVLAVLAVLVVLAVLAVLAVQLPGAAATVHLGQGNGPRGIVFHPTRRVA